MMTEKENSTANFLFVVASREEVEACNTSEVLNTLKTLISNPQTALQFIGNINLAIDGYDSDSRELFEIPQVRSYLKKLDGEFPYWFFFLSTNHSSLKLLAFSLCRITRVTKTSAACNQDDFANFLIYHYGAMNHLFDTFQIDEQMNEARTLLIREYFFDSEILN